ncbi:MAG: ATP-dependent sacrificial sulfur transferase LarE [Actinobacteria bacterium]|nr:ATP-dependent sacrificial sulfur transferase LarE [Actinomycetota bacterium]
MEQASTPAGESLATLSTTGNGAALSPRQHKGLNGKSTGQEVEGAELDRLKELLANLGRVVVAFSGGADSSLLAWVATRVLGRDSVLCVTACSPSLPLEEEEHCEALAAEWNLRWKAVPTSELEAEGYVRNGPDRCFHCKTELMAVLLPEARMERAVVALGVNLDDLGDIRPGQEAAASLGAVFPLLEAGFTKDLVRKVSRYLGLRTWDKPAAACLASRIPHGTPVSVEVLSRVQRSESALRRLGFSQVRVRHYDDAARVELLLEDLERAVLCREEIVCALHSAGYRYVTLDLEGFRSGNLAQAPGEPMSPPYFESSRPGNLRREDPELISERAGLRWG